jgi:drug/metabolite transporter (DMT)-like permease
MGYKIKAIISVILFATYPALGKLAMSENSAGVVNVVVGVLSVLALLLFFGAIGEWRKYCHAARRHELTPLFFMAFAAGVCGPFLYLYGLERASVLNAVLLLALQTPLTAVLSVMLLREKIPPSYFLSFAVLLFGMLVYSTDGFAHDVRFSWNDMYFVASAGAFASANVVYKKYLSHVSYDTVLLTRKGVRFSFDAHSFTIFFLIACLPILAAQTLWYSALRHLRAMDVAIVDGLYPLCTTLIAFVVLGESFTMPQFLGGALAGFGVVLASVHVHGLSLHRHQVALQHFKHH